MGSSTRRCASCRRFAGSSSRHPTRKRRFSAAWKGFRRWRCRCDVNNPRKRLGRLHKIRQMEEDQARLGLESTVAMLRRAQTQVSDALTAEQAARGRRNYAFLEPESEPYGWM